MPLLRLRSLACCALHCFSRGAGKGGRKGKSDRRSNSARKRPRRRAVWGVLYGVAGPAAVATATAAAILGSYCTGSRCGHVIPPARPSLLYAAGRTNERALARAPSLGAGAGCLKQLATPPRFRSPGLLGRMRIMRAAPSLWVRRLTVTPTAKICERKRNLLPGKADCAVACRVC